MFNEKEPVRNVSASRKRYYRLGQILLAVGLIVLFYNIFTFTSNITDFRDFNGHFQRKMALTVAGIVLIIGGSFLMKLGRYGKAGSGLNLDPEQERRDKEPLNRSTGAQIKDMLDEAGLGDIGSGKKEVIKVRCPHCQALNDETDKFCGQCGQAL